MMHKIAIYVGEDLLGDGILKLPFVRAIRQAFPASHITWIAGEKQSVYSTLLAPCVEGLIDTVISQGRHENVSLIQGPFDILIDTQNTVAVTKWLRHIPHKVFISRTHYFRWSHVKPSLWNRWKKPQHLIDQLLWLGSLAADKPLPRLIEPIRLPDQYKKVAQEILPAGKPYIGLAPGAGQLKKCWPLESYVALAKEQLERQRMPVFILGPQEQHWYSLLQEIFPEAQFPLQQHPLLLDSPLYTIALAQQFTVAVANDAGTGHLFGAAGIPLISLFGPTNPVKLHPLTSNFTVLRAPEPKNMYSLTVDKVIETVENAFHFP